MLAKFGLPKKPMFESSRENQQFHFELSKSQCLRPPGDGRKTNCQTTRGEQISMFEFWEQLQKRNLSDFKISIYERKQFLNIEVSKTLLSIRKTGIKYMCLVVLCFANFALLQKWRFSKPQFSRILKGLLT